MTQGFEGSTERKPRQPDMTYKEIVDAWNRRPVSSQIGSRRFRRRVVIGTYGGWLLAAAALKLVSLTYPHFPVIPVLVIANSVVQVAWLNRRTYINREVLVGDAGLDERLVQNRNQAFRRAFQMFAMFVLIAWPLSFVVKVVEPGNQGYFDAFLIYFAASLLATTLPTAIWAWREPDPAEPEIPTQPR
jgi:hypothetical protein